MDREVIIYIIFAIVYFVIRMMKKKQQPPDATDREPHHPHEQGESSPAPGPVTFEDLLRELTGQGKSQQAPPPPPPVQSRTASQRQTRDFRFPSDGDNYEEIHEEWEDKDVAVLKEGNTTRVFADEESKRIYEQSIYQVKSQEDELGKQLERAKSRFKEFEIKEEEPSAVREEIVEMLQSADGAKKAIILSEILNRKYE